MNVAEPNDDTNRDLEERVTAFLHSRQRPALQRIQVSATSGTVMLEGTVDSFYEKQLCIECCHRVDGVKELVDRIEVVDRDSW